MFNVLLTNTQFDNSFSQITCLAPWASDERATSRDSVAPP